jgi:Pyruvate/2-oxoacid:ferredoxin oxidoreductase delta subunit
MGGAVKSLDPKIGRIATKEEVKAHIRKGLDAGLYPLISHYRRDAMMFGLDFEKLLIVCFCCPCHCVVRNASRVSEEFDNSFFTNAEKFPTVRITLDTAKCSGCGKCVSGCMANAITLKDGKAILDADKCKGCGHCAYTCEAYSVSYDINDVNAVIDELAFNSDIS